MGGAVSATINALALTSIQEQVSDELSGRVFGVYALTNGLSPLGSLPAGTLAAQLGTANALTVWGMLGALTAGGLLVTQVVGATRRATRQTAPS